MIALVDSNNFFASCERLFRPDLKDQPVLVLSNNDGCVVARSQEVKALGIPMGVPYFKIRDIVARNNVKCFSSNFALYSNISQRVLHVLEGYSPDIEVYSIDEAFLNITNLPVSNYLQWGNKLRGTILRSVGMPVSVGIAPSKTLAKLASGYAKTHQQTCVLDPKDTTYFKQVLSDTPVGSVWGIGRRLAPRLERVGIKTAWQLSQASDAWLKSQMGITGLRMRAELTGEVAYPFHEVTQPQKSLLASRSFGHTVRSAHELETALASFASQAGYRLRKHGQLAGIFGVYLRFRDKDGASSSASAVTQFLVPTNDTSQLVRTAVNLLTELYDESYGYKKAGVFAHHLTNAEQWQQSLLDSETANDKNRRQQLMEAMDSINHRFGTNTLHVATLDPKPTRWQSRKQRISPAYTNSWAELPKVYPLPPL